MLANYFGVTTEDHLHTRGEYNEFSFASPFCVGSPPHTWRILEFLLSPLLEVRITSTHVENTIFVRCKGFNYWDHLHIRGEYTISFTNNFPAIGSPPHVWRISLPYFSVTICKRITSTCVENTDRHFVNSFWHGDHLHMCGEYWDEGQQFQQRIGSPPHVWRIQ